MAKAEMIQQEPKYLLHLNPDEAKLIKDLVQNCRSGFPRDEPIEQKVARESIFMSLKNAGV